jgi:biopolymer transport protein ExbD
MLLQRQLTLEADDHLDMTPMVDVVFQLMTFLLLTYHSVSAEVMVPRARYGIGVDEREAVVLTLARPEKSGDPVLVYSGMETVPTARLESPEAIRAAVEAGLAEGKRRVILEADGRVPHGEVLRVSGVIAEVEGVLLHIGVQEYE